jgi:hypothetical protein
VLCCVCLWVRWGGVGCGWGMKLVLCWQGSLKNQGSTLPQVIGFLDVL